MPVHPNYPPCPTESEHAFHARLAAFNTQRLLPRIGGLGWADEAGVDMLLNIEERRFIDRERARIQALTAAAPTDADGFIGWFETLSYRGPGQNDALFPWLEHEATLTQMRWFLTQEAVGKAGFEYLVALTQLRLPVLAKLEMAPTDWDEVGHGETRGMHGPVLAAVVSELRLTPSVAQTCWESLALANLMIGLAANRRYAYHAIGALGAIEMTAPGRAKQVTGGLRRLSVAPSTLQYFKVPADLDILDFRERSKEVIHSLVAADAQTAQAIAEGALLRLASGARCFERYRAHLDVPTTPARPLASCTFLRPFRIVN